MGKFLTHEEWVSRSIAVHGNGRYDYSNSIYKGKSARVEILCMCCMETFSQLAGNHMRGKGCQKCARASVARSLAKTQDQFVSAATELHNGKYDYNLVKYKNSNTKVEIVCPFHGAFRQKPYHHLSGHGCRQCAGVAARSQASAAAAVRFMSAAVATHGDRYLYDNTVYAGSGRKCVVTCRKHGPFAISPENHLRGSGCPKCRSSIGNSRVASVLSSTGIQFSLEAAFPGLSGRNGCPLRFDAFVPSAKLLIEYDGEVHYKLSWSHWSRHDLSAIRSRDRRKTRWAKNNGYKLVRIPYWEKRRIPRILFQALWREGAIYGPPVNITIRKKPQSRSSQIHSPTGQNVA